MQQRTVEVRILTPAKPYSARARIEMNPEQLRRAHDFFNKRQITCHFPKRKRGEPLEIVKRVEIELAFMDCEEGIKLRTIRELEGVLEVFEVKQEDCT